MNTSPLFRTAQETLLGALLRIHGLQSWIERVEPNIERSGGVAERRIRLDLEQGIEDALATNLASPINILGKFSRTSAEIPTPAWGNTVNQSRGVARASELPSLHLRFLLDTRPLPRAVIAVLREIARGVTGASFGSFDPVVTMSNSYNWQCTQLALSFERPGAESLRQPITPSAVLLPRIEVSNPLMWSGVFHEAAHLIFESNPESVGKTSDEDFVSACPEKSPECLEVWKAWAAETRADLVAYSLLGPAYIAFLTSVYLIDREDQFPHYSHPGLDNRIALLLDVAEKDPIDRFLKESVLDNAHRAFDHRSDLLPSTKDAAPGSFDFRGKLIQVGPMNEALHACASKAWPKIREPRLGPEPNPAVIRQMVEGLKENHPIGTRVAEPGVLSRNVTELLRSVALEKYTVPADRRRPALSQRKRQLFQDLLEMHREEAASMVDLFNAGWSYRYLLWNDEAMNKVGSGSMALQSEAYQSFRMHTWRFESLLKTSILLAHYLQEFQVARVAGERA